MMLIIGTGLTPAAQVSYDFTIPASGTPASVNFTNSADIPLFDPVMGTLLSIEIDLEGTINGTQFVENEDNNAIVDGTGATTVVMSLSNAAAGQLLSVAPDATFTFSVTGDTDVQPGFLRHGFRQQRIRG
ncbi:MAG: choice-of-anchor E domain-containing protein [Bryobacterales bacterium]|nr:choice-of-anchor E domain-containing protein [Bryobacterales bacterium]